MIAETVSLGILSLPSTLKAVGLVPYDPAPCIARHIFNPILTCESRGIVLLVGLGFLATYTGYVLGQFKLAYPQVHTFAEAGGIIGGPIMAEICAAGQMLFLGKCQLFLFLLLLHPFQFQRGLSIIQLTDSLSQSRIVAIKSLLWARISSVSPS